MKYIIPDAFSSFYFKIDKIPETSAAIISHADISILLFSLLIIAVWREFLLSQSVDGLPLRDTPLNDDFKYLL
jgi:hypothetical protein